MDGGLGIKHTLGIKCRLQTVYIKTALEMYTLEKGIVD